MFKRFRESPYAKAAFTILLCGAVLIVFSNWITRNRISIGFENINKTLAPIYIGGILAFILCPVYNACVKWSYNKMLENSRRKGFSIGAMMVHAEGEFTVDKQEKRKILAAARAVASLVCVILVVG